MKIPNNISDKFQFKLNSKPEKIIMTTALSVAGAILFDQKKKKLNHPEKYKNFFQRTKRNYKICGSLLDKTIAKDLAKNVEHYNSDVLENLEIKKGEFIDLE